MLIYIPANYYTNEIPSVHSKHDLEYWKSYAHTMTLPEEYKEYLTSNDYLFMKQAEMILKHKPKTWVSYQENEIGACQIVDMEYAELKATTDKEEKCKELVHLAAACLHAWRMMNNE